jgi:hypothetical protein
MEKRLKTYLALALAALMIATVPLTPANAVATASTQPSFYFKTIEFGSDFILVVATDGSLYAWGYNGDGQLGDGTTTDRSAPAEISVPGKTFEAVSAGGAYSLAIATDDSLYAWGYNGEGQLGDGTTTDRSAPVEISVPGKTFEAVSAGEDHSLAIATDGSLYAWGWNYYGQLGDGTTTDRSAPVEISVPGKTFEAVSAGD